jgi:hypothetical protein
MPIKGLTDQPRMPRLGKIHLGIKATNARGAEYPKKTDYFVCPELVHSVYGEQPRELDILFPYEDADVFASVFYRAYSYSRGLICKGDGELANRTVDVTIATAPTDSVEDNPLPHRDSKPENLETRQVVCAGTDCPDYQAGNCRPMMMLQFLLPNVPGLGVWQIDTSSWNSIRNILGGIELVRAMCGRISMIPLKLQLVPLEVTPQASGRRDTVYVLNLSADFAVIDLAKRQSIGNALIGTAKMLPEPDDEVPEDLVLDREITVDADTGEIITESKPEAVTAPPRPKPQETDAEPPIETKASLAALKSLNQCREAYNVSLEQMATWVADNYEGKTVRQLTDEQVDFLKGVIQNGGTFVADLKPDNPEPEPVESAEEPLLLP